MISLKSYKFYTHFSDRILVETVFVLRSDSYENDILGKREIMPVISIVIPTYNDGKYIKDCLNSVLNQTFRDIEVIIVNDNSRDDTVDHIKEIKDDRIILLNLEENKGVSNARNIGIEKAAGDYILFADADDIMTNDACERLYKVAKLTDADITCGETVSVKNEEIIRYKADLDNSNDIDKESGYTELSKTDLDYYCCIEGKFLGYPQKGDAIAGVWGELFKSSLIKDVKFDTDIRVGEDT